MLLTSGTTLSPRAGDTWVYDLAITRNGGACPLDRAELVFSAKHDLSDPDAAAVLSLRTGAGITHLATVGAARLVVPAALNRDLTPGVSLWWDVQLVEEGQPATPAGLVGRLIPLPDITQALS